LSGLNLDPDPRQALERLGGQLDSAYRQTAERLPENVALQIAEMAGADRPDLSKLEALDEPEQLSTLRRATSAMLPARVAFSEVLLEVCRWTGFADAFTHLSEGQARAEDLHVSICAVLLTEACNISLAEVANPGIPTLSPNRLSWVSQNYVRAETIAAANELLLDFYRRIPLVQALGDGHIATVDGLRFRVPVRSIHTGPNPRYFSRGRAVTWLNYLTDQFAGLHAIVVPGTLRDSLMILDGLLELAPPVDGGPTVIITDQASDQIFGLFWLLGYQFSPRPAGLPDQRFWRIDRDADYGPLDGLARNRVNVDVIVEQWEDILRVAGSLSTGTVRASELLRVLQGEQATRERERGALECVRSVRRRARDDGDRERRHQRDEICRQAEGDEHPGAEARNREQRGEDDGAVGGELAEERADRDAHARDQHRADPAAIRPARIGEADHQRSARDRHCLDQIAGGRADEQRNADTEREPHTPLQLPSRSKRIVPRRMLRVAPTVPADATESRSCGPGFATEIRLGAAGLRCFRAAGRRQ
jgi:TnpA family transposase